jgi:hypothetical protein
MRAQRLAGRFGRMNYRHRNSGLHSVSPFHQSCPPRAILSRDLIHGSSAPTAGSYTPRAP